MQASTVTKVFEERAQRAPDSPFFHCGAPADPWVTPGELDVRSGRLAGGLAGLGVGRGDRVALLAPNRVEVIEVLLAMAKLGAIQVPLNYWIRGEFLQYQLSDCGARVLIADRAGYETAAPLLSGTGIEHVVIIDDEPPSGGFRYADLTAADPVPTAAVSPGDLLSIVYTSGTTCKPKGCMLSHGYYAASPAIYGSGRWISPATDVHAVPLVSLGGPDRRGRRRARRDSGLRRHPRVQRLGVHARTRAELDATVLIGVGAIANAVLDQPRRPEDGAHPFRPRSCGRRCRWPAQHEFEERFGGAVMSEGFGQTRAC